MCSAVLPLHSFAPRLILPRRDHGTPCGILSPLPYTQRVLCVHLCPPTIPLGSEPFECTSVFPSPLVLNTQHSAWHTAAAQEQTGCSPPRFFFSPFWKNVYISSPLFCHPILLQTSRGMFVSIIVSVCSGFLALNTGLSVAPTRSGACLHFLSRN